MIYITGDLHGDASRLKRFARLIKRKRDFCLVCGDFGFVWDGSEAEKKTLAGLAKLDCTLLFVEGTHDNLTLLEQFPEEAYRGGTARRLASNILWLHRGDIFDLDGVSVFAMGGGESTDADERRPQVNWWPQELPTAEELARARENLAAHDNTVDLVITHQRPRIELGLIDERRERISTLTAFLGELNRTLRYRHWYFGCDHLDREISGSMSA
ncbi:MAG: metallophosphoesterase, partial [Oscillospiraceae bacterium]